MKPAKSGDIFNLLNCTIHLNPFKFSDVSRCGAMARFRSFRELDAVRDESAIDRLPRSQERKLPETANSYDASVRVIGIDTLSVTDPVRVVYHLNVSN